MSHTRVEQTGGDGQTATVVSVAPMLATERKLLPEGNVAIVRRYTNNAHRIYFSVEIGQVLDYPYTRGSTPEETEARIEVLEAVQMDRSSGSITDEFVVKPNERFPSLIGINPIDPEKRILTVEAPRDRATGTLDKVILRVPGNKPVEVDPSVLEALGDLKEGMIFGPVASQFFYDVQQGQFPAPEPTTLPSKPVV
jgi:hypothetical protein